MKLDVGTYHLLLVMEVEHLHSIKFIKFIGMMMHSKLIFFCGTNNSIYKSLIKKKSTRIVLGFHQSNIWSRKIFTDFIVCIHPYVLVSLFRK